MELLLTFYVRLKHSSVTWRLFIIYVYFSLGRYVSIVAQENTAVIVGQPMTMNCPSNESSLVQEWKIQRKANSSNSELLYRNWNWQNRSRIAYPHLGIDNEGNIYANSTELDDAGIYICASRLKTSTQPRQYSAQLIVFDTAPLCNMKLVVEQASQGRSLATMHCFVNYRGFWSPTAEWRLHDGNSNAYFQGRIITQGIENVIIPNTNISSTIKTTVNSTEYELFYSCRFYFSEENYSEITNATNIPLFSYTWNSSVFDSLQNESSSNISYQDSVISWHAAYSIYLAVAVSGIAFVLIALVSICRIVHVKRKATGSKIDLSARDHLFPAAREPGRVYIGSDGTEYMQMNAIGGQPASTILPTTPGMFSLVEEYAAIEHNFRIPPPPPRLDF